MTRGLYLADGSFREFAESRREIFEEVATRDNAMGAIFGVLDLLPDPDPVLRKRGDGPQVLRELRGDDKVISSIQTRKIGTLAKQDYSFEPGHARGEEPTAMAETLARDLERDLERVDLYNVFSEVLDAPYFGCSPVELIWEPADSRIRLADLRPRPVEWFGWSSKGELKFLSLDAPDGLVVHPLKFVAARHFPESSNPYGLRLLSSCLWPVLFKKGGLRFFVEFCERYGMPWVVGEAPATATSAERDAMLQGLAGMVRDAVAVVSAGSKVTVHDTSKGGGAAHTQLIKLMNSAIATVLVGQTLTAEPGDSGSYALGQVHGEVLEGYRHVDQNLVATFMNNVAWAYTQLNAPGEFCPVFAYSEPEDYQAQADLDGKLKGLGVRFSKGYFERVYALAPEDFEIETDTPNEKGFSFAEPAKADEDETDSGQEALERLIAGHLPETIKAHEERTKLVLDLAAKAENYEDLQLLLAEALPELTGDDLTQVFQAALVAADMTGRYAAGGGGDGA